MDAQQIRQVRSFNRIVTQHTGALDTSYLRRGRPLGEARLLFEIGEAGADIRVLRDRMGVDSGYLSRLLRSLEAQQLVIVHSAARDRRRRHVVLTQAGRVEVAAYDAASDDLATALLAPLSGSQRDRLVAAMVTVERLLRVGTIQIRVEPPDSPAARQCLQSYFDELARRFDVGFDPSRSNSASDAEMTPPVGLFAVAWIDAAPAGCGALKRGGDGIGEIKRMWTAPGARGLGVARSVLGFLEAKARETGLTTLRLETNRALTEAQALYRQEGYQEVDAFNAEPYAHHWFEKHL